MDKMEYIQIPLHGKYGAGKYTLVDGDYDGEYFSQYKWYLLPNGYVGRAKIEYPASERNGYIYLHKEVCKPPKNLIVDHIDRDKLNNRSCNLRWVTYKENARNRDNSNSIKANKSKALRPSKKITPVGYYGVYRSKDKREKEYLARIKDKYIGRFHTAEEAAMAYDKACIDMFGADAILNFN